MQQITGAELRPHIGEAKQLGVRTIYFTGGEAFVNEDVLRRKSERNEDFLQTLGMALGVANVEVLTNGRRYNRNHVEPLSELRDSNPTGSRSGSR